MANKTMKTLTIGSNTYEIVDESARLDIETLKSDVEILKENGSVNGSIVDDTLTQSGQAADAKVTGDAINQLSLEKVSNTRTINGKSLLEDVVIEPTDLNLATVATSGNYNDLTDVPTISDWALADTKPTYTADEVGAVNKTGDTMTGTLLIDDPEHTLSRHLELNTNNGTANFYAKLYFDSSHNVVLERGTYSNGVATPSHSLIIGYNKVSISNHTNASASLRNIVYSSSTPTVVNGQVWLKPVS